MPIITPLSIDTDEEVASNSAGCRYCQAHTIRAAERYGAETEKLENIWEYRTHPAFNEAERVALDFALTSSMIPNAVDEELQARLRAPAPSLPPDASGQSRAKESQGQL